MKSLISLSIKNKNSIDKIINNNDENLFKILTQWITYDLENREKFLSILLNDINFENMRNDFILNFILKNCLLSDKIEILMKIRNTFTKFLENNSKFNERNQLVAMSKNTHQLYAIFGGDIKAYNSEETRFPATVSVVLDKNIIQFGYSTLNGNNIFICGGSKYGIKFNHCEYYSLEESVWKSLPSMKIRRNTHSVVTLNNKIYVCGGQNERSVEIFDLGKNSWYDGPSIIDNQEWPGLCTFDNCIYVLKIIFSDGIHEKIINGLIYLIIIF